VGNFDADPLFFDPVGADGVIGTLDDNLRLDVGSPCIDAGNNDADIDASTDGLQPLPATDLDGNPRIIDDPDVADTGNPPQAGAIIDLGPHEHLTDDCNGNGAHDSADIGSGTSSDCNANLLPDECDIRAGTSTDCNTNGQPDECDITSGQSRDFDGDGLLDECDPDVDNDGVANESDVCNETAAGQPVNPRGGPMGDVTDDCVVTLADHYYFEFCLGDSGPAAPPLFLECVEVFDFDADGDVDLRDYASFQRLFGAD
jgi:hypothetical protein